MAFADLIDPTAVVSLSHARVDRGFLNRLRSACLTSKPSSVRTGTPLAGSQFIEKHTIARALLSLLRHQYFSLIHPRVDRGWLNHLPPACLTSKPSSVRTGTPLAGSQFIEKHTITRFSLSHPCVNRGFLNRLRSACLTSKPSSDRTGTPLAGSQFIETRTMA